MTHPNRNPLALVPALLVISSVLSGCVDGGEAGAPLGSVGDPDPESETATVVLPPAPARVTGQYQILHDNQTIATLWVRGDLPKMVATLELPSFADWSVELGHLSPGVLGNATVRCFGDANGSGREKCPRNDPESYRVEVPDARGAMGFLGLGPFLGSVLEGGTNVMVPTPGRNLC